MGKQFLFLALAAGVGMFAVRYLSANYPQAQKAFY
jgi:hypothetical protein